MLPVSQYEELVGCQPYHPAVRDGIRIKIQDLNPEYLHAHCLCGIHQPKCESYGKVHVRRQLISSCNFHIYIYIYFYYF